MATTANLPAGATPANAADDPFTASSHASLRYASFDTEQFSLYSSSSPSQAKRALEAHLKDTDRRIQDASSLGTTLLQQRKDLSARLKEVEEVRNSDEVPADLRKKLSDLEKEYNEVGKESARAFLPKSRVTSTGDVPGTPSAFSGSGRESPTKASAPSRRQRNQPSNRIHDIEFATEISTSLLAQVRQLQGALVEKDDLLKHTTGTNAQLEADVVSMAQRIKHMGESEQRYKDETWNLETRLQELEANFKQSTDKEQKLAQTLKAVQSDKAAAQRDLDDLKVSHEKLYEDHAIVKKQQESDLHVLRRDIASHETEKQRLRKKVEELTSQNTELARAVSYRLSQSSAATDTDFVSAEEDQHMSDDTPENSEPASPVKGTPRHGMLESETLKSSLSHAHRMIQNLKNNIHREKTEKIELKRMLQDARDELETRRGDSGGAGANVAGKRRTNTDSTKFRKPAKVDRLGANRSGTTEILEDEEPDWEDHDGESTPSKSQAVSAGLGGAALGTAFGAAGANMFHHADPESTDTFDTATENEGTTTDAFETGQENMDSEDSDELTETEGGASRSGDARKVFPTSNAAQKHTHRLSIDSTASASSDEMDEVRTPIQNQQPKYRIRVARGSRRSRIDELSGDSPGQYSPTSSTGTPQPAGQSLGDELDAMDEGSIEGTPRSMIHSESTSATPLTQRSISVDPKTPERHVLEKSVGSASETNDHGHEMATPESPSLSKNVDDHPAALQDEMKRPKPSYTDAGVMTEPLEPDWEAPVARKKSGLRKRAGDVVGGALAGFGLGRLRRNAEAEDDSSEEENLASTADLKQAEDQPATALDSSGSDMARGNQSALAAAAQIPDGQNSRVADTPIQLQQSPICVQETEPIAENFTKTPTLQHSAIYVQETEPVSPPRLSSVEERSQAPDVPYGLFLHSTPSEAEATAPQQAADLGFAPIVSQEVEPEALPEEELSLEPKLLQRSSEPSNNLSGIAPSIAMTEHHDDKAIPGTDGAKPGVSFFGANVPPPPLLNDRALPTSSGIVGSESSAQNATNLVAERQATFGEEEKELSKLSSDRDGGITSRAVLSEVPSNSIKRNATTSTDPALVEKPMTDEGSQTMISGADIESMMKSKTRVASMVSAGTDASASPSRPSTAIGPSAYKLTVDGVAIVGETTATRGSRRPTSSGSSRGMPLGTFPPLPEDHFEKIAAAAQNAPETPSKALGGTMGPPLMPASAYKQNRPSTPSAQPRVMSRDGTTPRPGRASRGPGIGSPAVSSRRTSVSSFASELDERFNIPRGQLIYPDDIKPSTDPRMIQAITQTMIGEYLWKYTRKAGRSETSSTRHRRFFWIHPYTRTLYWSEKDPSTAGRDMLKAKSVAINAVRVVTDDNAYPPGLHRKSLVIVTPGREIVFTAPTGQRHETWFNALSYLLLRTEQEKEEAEDTIDQDDLDEFNPGLGSSIRRSISRVTGRNRSRVSLSSYNSRTTRNSSPTRTHVTSSLAQRQSAGGQRASDYITPTLIPNQGTTGTSGSRHNTNVRDSASGGGRLSSITSKFRAPTTQHGSVTTTRRGRSSFSGRGRPGDPSEIYDASIVSDSAEDLRAVMERQEKDADRLENVRACCDGKHDVGSLSRTGRHSRFAVHSHTHTHTHAHAHPRTEAVPETSGPRKGE